MNYVHVKLFFNLLIHTYISICFPINHCSIKKCVSYNVLEYNKTMKLYICCYVFITKQGF